MRKSYFQPITKTVFVCGQSSFANDTISPEKPSGTPSADYMKDPGMSSNESFFESDDEEDNGLPKYGW